MQTFITANAWSCHPGTESLSPVEVCKATAAVLDTPRLGKQRVEAKQIYTSLVTGTGWVHHPATKMWEGFLEGLAFYGATMCAEWRRRGFEDSLMPWFSEQYDWMDFEQCRCGEHTPGDGKFPWWFGHPEMVESHRSKLLRKMPEYYSKFCDGSVPQTGRVNPLRWDDEQYAAVLPLPYIWPTPSKGDLLLDDCEEFKLSGAEYKRTDWEVPGHWKVLEDRRVQFK